MDKPNKVVKFPARIRAIEISVPNAPTVEQAWLACQDFIHLQHIYPMLQTIEEQENNLAKSKECLQTMNDFILASYLNTTGPETVN